MKSIKIKPERAGAARYTFGRLIAICVELTRPQGASQPEISRQFQVSTKTVQRDFDYIRDFLLLPVEYDRNSRRWAIKSTAAIRRIGGIGAVFENLS